MAAAKERADRESQAGATGDARTWVAGALASSTRTKEERVGSRGSSRAELNLAVGHDEDLDRSCGLGVSGVRDRLLHAGDCGMESLASLPAEDALAAVEQAVLDTIRENFMPWAFFGASLPGGSSR